MPSPSNIALGISYSGTNYHGWQYQGESIATLQSALEEALGKVADERVRVTCAGRTDSGVHATKQVINFPCRVDRPLQAWVMGTNTHLADTISVTWSRMVPIEFDARKSAVARRYYYLIYNQKVRSGIFPNMYTREHRLLDADRMHSAGQHLLGENDFSSFRAANCQSHTPRRNVQYINVSRKGELILIDIQANAFLHHMVRNIAGVLLDIGAGEKPVDWTKELLALKDRKKASITATAEGLYLVDVIYPDFPQIPEGPELPHILSLLT